MPEWTSRQQEAISARNPEILVSAAAGSGKTAVLIARVMGLLGEGLQLDRLLVVTFTRAAAEEMKERLTDYLSEAAQDNPHLQAQYALLGRADISTLHSFCGRLIKQHFQAAGLDPLSRLADEALAGELLDEALDELLDALYENPDVFDQSLIARFDTEQICQMVLALYRFLMAQDAPFEWLTHMVETSSTISLYDHPWYAVVVEEACLLLQGASDLLETARQLCLRPDGPASYEQALKDDLALVALLRQRLQEEKTFTWTKPSYTRMPSKPASEQEDPALRLKIRDGLRKQAKALVAKALALLPQNAEEAATWMADLAATQPQLQSLARLTTAVYQSYQQKKAARALHDYSDLEHLSLKALQDPLVRQQVAAAYDALFVDEYQDISRIQEAIIRCLRSPRNSLFMVGDVKQSIYRFRLADPSLFLHKQRHFSTDREAACRLITLRDNFRSKANILSAVNLVFEGAMRADATEIDYDAEARLTTLSPEQIGPPVSLWLVEKDVDQPEEELTAPLDMEEDEEEVEAEEEGEDGGEAPSGQDKAQMERAFVYEARLIAREVARLVGTPLEEGGGSRLIQYRDIAILLRSATRRAKVLAEELASRGIPSYSEADGSLYTQSEVTDLLNVLKVLDNPCQDIPLLSVLACPAFSFSPDQLAGLRLYAKDRDLPLHLAFFELARQEAAYRLVADRLSRWRSMAGAMPLAQFLSQLIWESGLYALAGAREEGNLRRANLRILAAKAAPQPEPLNLADFVERAQRSLKQKSRDQGASLGMQENVVRIMTLHKSKGLQFPVVILPELAAVFSQKRSTLSLRMDAATGLAVHQIDPDKRIKNEGFGMQALKIKKAREEISEEARLLYVGMTRAKERLILVGSPDRLDSALDRWSLPMSSYAAGSAKGMLDWVCRPIYPALAELQEGIYEAAGGSRWQVQTAKRSELTEGRARLQATLDLPTEEAVLPEDLFAPVGQASTLPQKSSVTALLRRELSLEEETPEIKRRQAVEGLQSQRKKTASQGLTAAQRGAAAHKALCALDSAQFAGLSEADLHKALAPALDALKDRGLLLPQERAGLDPALLARFYQSPLAARLAASPERHAEWAFTLLAEGDMILQGVLDSCFIEDDQWVLIDYKTDWAEPDTVLARYTSQMRWYMRALREITGKGVKEAWLYLLRSGQAVQVQEQAPIQLDTSGEQPAIERPSLP